MHGSAQPLGEQPLAYREEFQKEFGACQALLSTAELLLSFALGRFMNLTPEETRTLTCGMEFARKATVLRSLVARSDHPERQVILELLDEYLNDPNRSVIADGLFVSTPSVVTFIARGRGREVVTQTRTFTLEEFQAHVDHFVDVGARLQDALGLKKGEIGQFVTNALDELKV